MKKAMIAATLIGLITGITACSSEKISEDEAPVAEMPVTITETQAETTTVSESVSSIVTTVGRVPIEITPEVYDFLKHIAGNYIEFSTEEQAKIIACIMNQAEMSGGNIYIYAGEMGLDVTSIYYGPEHIHYSDLSDSIGYYCDNKESLSGYIDFKIEDGTVSFEEDK